MRTVEPTRSPAGYVITLPDGWAIADEPDSVAVAGERFVAPPDEGYRASITVRTFDAAGAPVSDEVIDQRHSETISELTAWATDPFVVDDAWIPHERGDARLTVLVHRQGPFVVTNFIATVPSPSGVVALQAMTDGDRLPFDRPDLEAAIASLTFQSDQLLGTPGEGEGEGEGAPEADLAGEREAASRVMASFTVPTGWEAREPSDPAVFQVATTDSNAYRPTITASWQPKREPEQPLVAAHAEHVQDLLRTLTDPVGLREDVTQLAGYDAVGTTIRFRQGAFTARARIWTVDALGDWVVALGLCDNDDVLALGDIDDAIRTLEIAPR